MEVKDFDYNCFKTKINLKILKLTINLYETNQTCHPIAKLKLIFNAMAKGRFRVLLFFCSYKRKNYSTEFHNKINKTKFVQKNLPRIHATNCGTLRRRIEIK